MAFLTKQTLTPLKGPITNEAIRAGSSDISSLINEGIKGTLMLKNISTVLTAARIMGKIMAKLYEKKYGFTDIGVSLEYSHKYTYRLMPKIQENKE